MSDELIRIFQAEKELLEYLEEKLGQNLEAGFD